MKFSKVGERTLIAYAKHPRYLSSCGGTRSGKTYSIMQMLITIAWKEQEENRPASVNSVVSETYPHLRRGAIRDFQNIMETEGIWEEDKWSKTESTYTFGNGTKIEFFSADSPAKVHGAARDRLFINECQNIPYEIARQLFVRTRGQIILDYNPTQSFWLNEKIEPDESCERIHSTYLDNDFLSKEQIAEIERNRSDANWWRVYGEGKVGQLEGLIYDFEQIDSLPEVGDMVETFGLDFGFTHDPSVLTHCLIHTGRKEIYIDEVFYQRGMLNSDMAAAMEQNEVGRYAPIYADAAEPKTIAELASYGFNILPCYKATRKAEQIQTLRGYRLFVTKRSTNTIRELRGYVWAKDREGNPTNEPIAFADHAMDSFRYAVFTFLNEATGAFGFGFGRDYDFTL